MIWTMGKSPMVQIIYDDWNLNVHDPVSGSCVYADLRFEIATTLGKLTRLALVLKLKLKKNVTGLALVQIHVLELKKKMLPG